MRARLHKYNDGKNEGKSAKQIIIKNRDDDGVRRGGVGGRDSRMHFLEKNKKRPGFFIFCRVSKNNATISRCAELGNEGAVTTMVPRTL